MLRYRIEKLQEALEELGHETLAQHENLKKGSAHAEYVLSRGETMLMIQDELKRILKEEIK